MVDHIVSNFRNARVKLVEYIKQHEKNASSDKKKENKIPRSKLSRDPKTTIPSTINNASRFVPLPNEIVNCPVCDTPLQAQFINDHIDNCKGRSQLESEVTVDRTCSQASFIQP